MDTSLHVEDSPRQAAGSFNAVPYLKFNTKISWVFQYAVRGALSLLLLVILLAICWATVKTLLDLKTIFTRDMHEALKIVMVNSLTVLALLEVFMTALAYFEEGRVKVTYIIDTVLVVILTEVMVFWFKEIEYMRIVMVIVLVLSLIIARILAIRFSPARTREEI
ncbi:MAG: phosphate-starvation-inducible PsiE family protein [Deltaproteobacteria bacterium]|nr:phosphate-starvation-inducible PsiE family protein [Deltaproteobacteria bacterium]